MTGTCSAVGRTSFEIYGTIYRNKVNTPCKVSTIRLPSLILEEYHKKYR